ncbi:3-hydroxyacyl-CoA dehydrogenase [Noviherbaspirillum denitrificans]|uniref:3-hydroxyacyl-CoA dehydrogenase n=1 Tax=Noviherbaspirillum denitrificans TaxID=1968433 RepID=A0A254TG50_9BURK|nr:3-hydroxyacyl-CoA dehydrogenase [Noviherbaspirillum denitrificans]OWW21636.1 3-hydroxyacyl-CoA dehydrogenase [Noviherbaspirillum denitrificans]
MQNGFPPSPGSRELKVGVVGCGVMGRGIVQIAALAGATVYLVDSREGASQAAREELRATFAKLVEKGKLDAAAAADAGERLVACKGLDELAPCHVVVEAIVEDLEAKKSLFGTLEGIVGSEAILASNTSSLSVTAIAAGLQHPDRVAGFHFFNPVPLMKIVEVIGGFLTRPEITEYMLALGRQWGHTAVLAKDTPGFIVNHAGRGYGTEGLRLLAEGICSVPALDAILRDTAGFRLGPCELLDLTGLDVSHPVMESIYRQYYEEPRFRPQVLTRQMLTAGALGRKVGRGFYRYGADGKKEAVAEPAQATLLPSSVWLSQERPELAERIAVLVSAAGVQLESSALPSDHALCIVTPLGEDATTCCVREGLDASRTVAVESLLDLSRRRVVMTNPATSAETVAMACGLLGAAGVPVSVIRDSAGLVTQRVVAHIVNIACEIAQQQIADPQDIDRAVVLGLGYPVGPLAWGDQLGAMTVLAILKNLEQQTGDTRYRPSPWLQRRAMLGLSLHHKEI